MHRNFEIFILELLKKQRIKEENVSGDIYKHQKKVEFYDEFENISYTYLKYENIIINLIIGGLREIDLKSYFSFNDLKNLLMSFYLFRSTCRELNYFDEKN